MADKVDHTHGDKGTKPPQDLNFTSGGKPDAEEFDWFWSQVPAAINNHADTLESIDSDGDGTVDAADTAGKVKGNDIDSDGDGKVDAADSADTASAINGVSFEELADVSVVGSGSITISGDSFTSPADISNLDNNTTVLGQVISNNQDGSDRVDYGRGNDGDLAWSIQEETTNGEFFIRIDNKSSISIDVHYAFWKLTA